MAPADVSNHSVEQAHPSVHAITKAMDIPVVKSAVFYASDLYQRVKTVSPILESGLSRAEQTVLLVADSAKPVIRQFEGPSEYFVICPLFQYVGASNIFNNNDCTMITFLALSPHLFCCGESDSLTLASFLFFLPC